MIPVPQEPVVVRRGKRPRRVGARGGRLRGAGPVPDGGVEGRGECGGGGGHDGARPAAHGDVVQGLGGGFGVGDEEVDPARARRTESSPPWQRWPRSLHPGGRHGQGDEAPAASVWISLWSTVWVMSPTLGGSPSPPHRTCGPGDAKGATRRPVGIGQVCDMRRRQGDAGARCRRPRAPTAPGSRTTPRPGPSAPPSAATRLRQRVQGRVLRQRAPQEDRSQCPGCGPGRQEAGRLLPRQRPSPAPEQPADRLATTSDLLERRAAPRRRRREAA